jgi:hypothetical protein
MILAVAEICLLIWRHIQNLCGFSTPTAMGQSFIISNPGRKTCTVDNINGWEKIRMEEQVKILRDKSPNVGRSTGRPRKRWCDKI